MLTVTTVIILRHGPGAYLNYTARRDAFLDMRQDGGCVCTAMAERHCNRGSNHLRPRSMAFAGLLLRARTGAEMWDYLIGSAVSLSFWVYREEPTSRCITHSQMVTRNVSVMMARGCPRYPRTAGR